MNLNFDTLGEGLLVTLIGICIVFLGLVVLILLISLINRLTGGITRKPKDVPPAPPIRQELSAPVTPDEPEPVPEDELIAVIAAAIAMMTAEESRGFVVRRVRRISNAPVWNKAGREEQVYSRY
ncbi:MAG: OadG family protein [Clostridia bacterium]|nr:OadG family protein [Clostridia bacterium]